MPHFRKRPVTIEARQLTRESVNEIAEWLEDENRQVITVANFEDESNFKLHISTLEGVITARLGDWIIQGVHGEFYPCKPDIFEQTYEPVYTEEEIEAGYKKLAEDWEGR